MQRGVYAHISNRREGGGGVNRDKTANGSILFSSPVFESFRQMEVRYDSANRIIWAYINPEGRACLNIDLLGDLRNCFFYIEQYNRTHFQNTGNCPIRYTILGSKHPTVYSYGGDLSLFKKMILERDRDGLRSYAQFCIDTGYLLSVNCNLPMTTIALVQGEALGGGFEGALCCSVLIAEKRARFGLPEILFNLIPGMGAYQFLARRLPMKKVEEIITSGNVYTAEEMYEIGVVDVLSEDGAGEKTAYEFVREHSRRRNARNALSRVRQDVFRVTKADLERTADIWVDAALGLADHELKLMERLVRAQEARENANVRPLRARRESAT